MANTLTIGFGGIDQSSTIKLKSFAVLFYIYLRPFVIYLRLNHMSLSFPLTKV